CFRPRCGLRTTDGTDPRTTRGSSTAQPAGTNFATLYLQFTQCHCRIDPHRSVGARELLVDFADFTRYSLGTEGDFTTLEDELAAVEHYVVLEKARFGQRLQVSLDIAPEVLGLEIPFLSVQPLVENAV